MFRATLSSAFGQTIFHFNLEEDSQMTNVTSRQFTLVTFYTPGSFMPNESTKEVPGLDTEQIAAMAPKNAYSFIVQEFIEKTTTVDGEDLKKTEAAGQAHRYYIGGKLYTVDELKAEFTDDSKSTLISNMEGNDWPKVILCRTGNWQPL